MRQLFDRVDVAKRRAQWKSKLKQLQSRTTFQGRICRKKNVCRNILNLQSLLRQTMLLIFNLAKIYTFLAYKHRAPLVYLIYK